MERKRLVPRIRVVDEMASRTAGYVAAGAVLRGDSVWYRSLRLLRREAGEHEV
jgi:hypothetical protein